MTESIDFRDFFISFNSADLAYAAAIDAALREAGFSTYYHPRDLGPDGYIPAWMDRSLDHSAQTLALYSPDYTKDKAVYSKAEVYASWWQDPGGDKRKLVPVLLRQTEFSALIRPLKRIDVTGLAPQEAGAHVVKALKASEEAQPRDVWRRGLPLPKIFNAAYRPNPNFTGRFEAMESLQKALRGGNAAVTAVAGMGGVGKSTLAAEYCHRFGGRYGGVWWVRAEQEPVMLADLQTLGQRLSVVEGKNTEVDARTTLDYLASLTEPWLLVYDNAPNPDAVAKWLPAGAVRCLITSRFTEFGGIAKTTRLDQWSGEVTAGYLLSRTGRKDEVGAARLARSIGGLPLAAEQAAAYLRPRAGVSFDDYAAEIASLIKRKRDAGIAGDYPDTVYAAFVKSLETLGQTEVGKIGLDILRLGAFLSPDGIDLALLTVEWGAEVLPAPLAAAMANKPGREDALAALTLLSLLRQESGPVGLVLIFHRLLLEVARDWMGEDARVLWSAAAVKLASGAFPFEAGSNTSSWPLCARLLPHVAQLQAYAPPAGEAGRALGRLLNQASIYLNARGDHQGALLLTEGSLALARSTSAEDPLGLAISLSNLGTRYINLDRLPEAEAAFREAMEIEEPRLNPNDPSLAVTISNLAEVHWRRKHFAEAEVLRRRAAEIMRATHGAKSAEYGMALSNLAVIYADWADEPGEGARRAQEEKYSTQGLTVTRAARGERHPETATRRNNIAAMRARRSDWPAAEFEAERAVAIMLSLDLAQHPRTQVMAGQLVHFWAQAGQADKAARLRAGDFSDLLPVIARIEAEHRTWVAEDPANRRFGPPSPFASLQGNFKLEPSEQIAPRPTEQPVTQTQPAPYLTAQTTSRGALSFRSTCPVVASGIFGQSRSRASLRNASAPFSADGPLSRQAPS